MIGVARRAILGELGPFLVYQRGRKLPCILGVSGGPVFDMCVSLPALPADCLLAQVIWEDCSSPCLLIVFKRE